MVFGVLVVLGVLGVLGETEGRVNVDGVYRRGARGGGGGGGGCGGGGRVGCSGGRHGGVAAMVAPRHTASAGWTPARLFAHTATSHVADEPLRMAREGDRLAKLFPVLNGAWSPNAD